jgi:ATP-dependent Lon protease
MDVNIKFAGPPANGSIGVSNISNPTTHKRVKNTTTTTTTELNNKNKELYNSIKHKIYDLQDMIRNTIIAIQRYKKMEVLSSSEVKLAYENLKICFKTLDNASNFLSTSLFDKCIDCIQSVTTDLTANFRLYGSMRMFDVLSVCFGSEYTKKISLDETILFKSKLEILGKYFHPINYKIITWKKDKKKNSVLDHSTTSNSIVIKKNRIIEDFTIVEDSNTLECFDLARTSNNFQLKVHGIKVALHNYEQRKTMIICGVIDDILLECMSFYYINYRLQNIIDNKPNDTDFNSSYFNRYIKTLTLKDLLIYSNDELYNRFIGHVNQQNLIKKKNISQIVKEFITSELFTQRNFLITLLIKNDDYEIQYLAYLLYDLLTNDTNGSIDTQEQSLLYDSLPFCVREYFQDAMKKTIQYTQQLNNYENNKIPIEQQIYLLKANDSVKEKAMLKLKEVKSKNEDSGSKARQYLDGLIRIPFGNYKQEPILNSVNECVDFFTSLIDKTNNPYYSSAFLENIPIKTTYTTMEVKKYTNELQDNYYHFLNNKYIDIINDKINKCKRNELINIILTINLFIKNNSLNVKKLLHSGKKNSYMIQNINLFFENLKNTNSNLLVDLSKKCQLTNSDFNPHLVNGIISDINKNISNITSYIHNVSSILDNAVHGHTKAKRQIERIIGQWINGEKTGYCFGFEGPPGVGKTSLAKKGIANCLKDENGVSRPFSFIAIGGSSNGSTLDGHNYTYVGSTWGRIVDILMETKCMNPIIFIDELDKVSKTENGKEIIGILTHLIDPTQNDCFQDKYFNGIDLDLSKALFIFSYNDIDAIDKILLDRIHRVKFEHLSLSDKLIISRKYLLPEIYTKMGLNDVIDIGDDIVEFLIEEYTHEPGVRKLKELLFEIIGEINLSILKYNNSYEIPIKITKEDIRNNYLKERHEIKLNKIHTTPKIGVINGLWANSLGKGGILPIEVSFFPSSTFLDLKLTGMQGDVMKESMIVAKTLAWNLFVAYNQEKVSDLVKTMETTKLQGIHIHVPEGATPKDGPSAGTAITVAIYSLLSQKKIMNDVAITGEICLQGNITEIGGLDLKLLGGIKAGVKTFVFPSQNKRHFQDFISKYNEPNQSIYNLLNDGSIKFIQANTIEELFDLNIL